jgi:ATP-dependent RNA helicase DDX46/PRP5
MRIAQESIERALFEYKPSVSTEKGVEQAAKIIEEWVERENEKNNIFTCELDINDYPNVTRGKVLRKDFLENMAEMTQCTVTIRGTFVEPGKKVPLGQKKIHLYIQGNTKTDVAHAYREIKKILDESALIYYTKGATMGYAGKTGKYNI